MTHLDSGYDGKPSLDVLAEHGVGEKGFPSPIRDAAIIDFYLYLAATSVTLRCLIQKARQTRRFK